MSVLLKTRCRLNGT